MAACWGERVVWAKGGERVWREWPILLMAREGGWRRWEVWGEKASGRVSLWLGLGLNWVRRGRGGHTFFEEEADLVAAGQEVVVADVLVVAAAGGELGHGMVGERDVVEHVLRFGEEGGDGAGVQGVGDDEVAIFLVEG